jgi:hypothetical protein
VHKRADLPAGNYELTATGWTGGIGTYKLAV